MSKPSANPFFEADFSKFVDMSKAMGEFKIPSFNVEALMAAQRRNLEVMTAVNQAAFESWQSLIRRQAEMARQTFEEATNTISAVISSETPEEKLMRQAEASKSAVDKCLANARDIAETVAKCNYQAMETVSNRLNEGLEEFRSIMKNNNRTAA